MDTKVAISARSWARRVGSVCMWTSIQKTREADFVLMLYRGISGNRRVVKGDGTYAQRRSRSQAALTPGLV